MNPRAYLRLTLVGLLALNACVVGPTYTPPKAPEGFAEPWRSMAPTLETAQPPPDDWWRLYDDALLDSYLREAFAENRNLAAAEHNLAAARALLSEARAGRYPTTEIGLGGVYGRDATTDEILGIVGAKNQTIWKYDDVLDVAYELDLFGRVRRSIEAAKADAGATQAARDAVAITVAAETTRAYVDICSLGQQIDVARHSLAVVSRQAEITRSRGLAGDASQFDVVRDEALVAQVRASIPPLDGRRRAALFELAALIGKTPALAPEQALSCRRTPTMPAILAIGDGQSLLRRRPDVREAERRLAAATARVGVATADLYPRITLSGFYGGAAGSLGDLSRESGLTWGVGPSISWAFPNQAAPRARLRASKADAAADLDLFDGAVLQALKETEQALSGYSAELDRRQALLDAQAKEHRAFALAQGQLAAGAVSNLDLLTTEQAMVAADATVAASDAAVAQDQIALFKALGGGWKAASVKP